MPIPFKALLVPVLLGAGLGSTTAYAGSYSIQNLTKSNVIIIQENWIHAPIILAPNQEKSFKSKEFSKQTVIMLDEEGNVKQKTAYAISEPTNGGRTVWKGNWNWQVVPEKGLIRWQGW